MGQIKTVCHLIGCNETNTAHLCDFCAKDTELESSQEETSHLRTFYKTRPIILQSIEFMKPKERRTAPDSKGLKRHENYRQSSIHLILNWLFTKKTLLKQLAKHEWVWGWHSSNISIFISDSLTVVQLCRRMSLFIGDIHLNVSSVRASFF